MNKLRVVFCFAQNKIAFFCKALLLNILIFILFSFNISFNNFNQSTTITTVGAIDNCGTNEMVSAQLPKIKDLLDSIFGIDKSGKIDDRKIEVYPGGFPLGFTMECEGVLIVALGSVETINGLEKPTAGKNIKQGDVLYSINERVIQSAVHLNELLNAVEDEEYVDIVLKRGSTYINERVKPLIEVNSGNKRLGLWIRDNAAGVGTLTYVRKDNLRFGALGHSVCDIDTGKIMPISKGLVYNCNIVGVNKGLRGSPGELRGLFLKTGKNSGVLDNNNDYGVFGVMGEDYVEKMSNKPIEVGFRNEVKTGRAKILCTIDGFQPDEYDIEIVKLSYQNKSNKKSMVIKVVDDRLISETGGIVQGMSGSPIIQNGKLVGAVTHVFVADPTKGFGVYIDWMIDN